MRLLAFCFGLFRKLPFDISVLDGLFHASQLIFYRFPIVDAHFTPPSKFVSDLKRSETADAFAKYADLHQIAKSPFVR